MRLFRRGPSLEERIAGATRSAVEAARQEFSSELGKVEAAHAQERARLESLLSTMRDPDEFAPGSSAQGLYRSATGGYASRDCARDFDDANRQRILSLSQMAYALRGDAENLIESHLDFMLGDALAPRSDTPALLELVEEVWEDPRSALDQEHEPLTTSALVDGELVLRADVSPADGRAELGWTDPLAVTAVLQDSRRRDVFLQVKAKSGEPDELWFVLQALTEDLELVPFVAPPVPEGETAPAFRWTVRDRSADGVGGVRVVERHVHHLCFFLAWNRLAGATRGRGELTSVLDMIDASDELRWAAVDVQNLRRLFLLVLKDPSIRLPAEGKDRLKALGMLTPPKNPKVLAVNDKVEIEIKNPQTTAETDRWLSDELGASVYGAKGFPSHWRGSSSGQGLAAARAMDLLPLRRLRRKQRRLTRFWHRVVEVLLDLRRRFGGVTIPEGAFVLETIEVGGKDKQRGSEIVKAMAAAATQMSAAGASKRELLSAVFVQALREAGFEVPTDLEGVPDESEILGQEVASMVQNLVTQKSRTDEGNQDEGDRERADERMGEGGRRGA